MSQLLTMKTPNDSPERNVLSRRESPISMRYGLGRSPTKSPTRRRSPTRRKSLLGGGGSIPTLSRSNSLQGFQRMNQMTGCSVGSSPVNSNSGSPLKMSLVAGSEGLCPLRRSYSPTRSSPPSPLRRMERRSRCDNGDTVPFTFFEGTEDVKDSIIRDEYSKPQVLSLPLINDENIDPNTTGKSNNQPNIVVRNGGSAFQELSSEEFIGSITDPKTNETIYLD